MLKKALIFLTFLLLTTTVQVLLKQVPFGGALKLTPDDGIVQTENPLGDGEENNSGSDRDASEDDDVTGFDHVRLSIRFSATTSLHFSYQQSLFNGLSREVTIPPPKA